MVRLQMALRLKVPAMNSTSRSHLCQISFLEGKSKKETTMQIISIHILQQVLSIANNEKKHFQVWALQRRKQPVAFCKHQPQIFWRSRCIYLDQFCRWWFPSWPLFPLWPYSHLSPYSHINPYSHLDNYSQTSSIAGVSWTLTFDEQLDAETLTFSVGEDCPYYNDGYKHHNAHQNCLLLFCLSLFLLSSRYTSFKLHIRICLLLFWLLL